ncbi:hypothetical protein CHUAL_002360 [Chamberlinius hualienensis]
MEEFLTEVEYNRLSECLDVLCSGLSEIELKHLKDSTTSHLSQSLQDEINDGRDLAIVLRRYGICDETNIQNVRMALKQLKRYDLLRMAFSHERKSLKVNLLEEFLHQENLQREKQMCEVSSNANENHSPPLKRRLRSSDNPVADVNCYAPQTRKKRRVRSEAEVPSSSSSQAQDVPVDEHYETPHTSNYSVDTDNEIKSRYTCDVRLRVWAEYCNHERHLNENVFSNKEDPFERQLERFSQASTIIQSRELGYIVCDIKFSEITYLDAFWRDYLNGSLLEALKGKCFYHKSFKVPKYVGVWVCQVYIAASCHCFSPIEII